MKKVILGGGVMGYISHHLSWTQYSGMDDGRKWWSEGLAVKQWREVVM